MDYLCQIQVFGMKRLLIALSVASVVGAACSSGGNKPEVKETKTIKMATEECSYQVNPENVQVKWTAFKFTNKTGVGGQFDSVSVGSSGTLAKPQDALQDMSFTIPVSKINTNNPDRDKKIQDYFFGALDNTASITGKIVSYEGSEREGDVLVNLMMNGVSSEVGMKYFVEGQSVTINGAIDVGNWNALGGITALNSVCKDLHTGDDGVSKLWPNVDIEVVAILDKTCN